VKGDVAEREFSRTEMVAVPAVLQNAAPSDETKTTDELPVHVTDSLTSEDEPSE
jgi:hypothetical protein